MSPLETFITNPKQRNVWLKHGSFSIYIRRATHIIEGQPAKCVDIANIINYKAEARGQGKFWQLITTIKRQALLTDAEYIYIEQVLNKQLAASLTQRGYILTTVDGTPSFALKL